MMSDTLRGASTYATRIVNVVAVNDAPLLDNSGNPSLPDVNSGDSNPAGATVASLLGLSVSDPDAGALLGIVDGHHTRRRAGDAPASDGQVSVRTIRRISGNGIDELYRLGSDNWGRRVDRNRREGRRD
jgi:hypothetical protein